MEEIIVSRQMPNVLQKAGLCTYWLENITPMEWPIKTRDRIPLLLAKIYFNTEYTEDMEEIIVYFELPSTQTLLTNTLKRITKETSGILYNSNIINSIKLDFLNNLDEKQVALFTEFLFSF